MKIMFALLAAGVLVAPQILRAAGPADYGKRPSDKEIGKLTGTFIRNHFKDPRSIQDLKFYTVQPVDVSRGLLAGGGHIYGWQVLFSVNAKNGFGGYSGQQAMYLLIARGQVVGHRSADEAYWTFL